MVERHSVPPPSEEVQQAVGTPLDQLVTQRFPAVFVIHDAGGVALYVRTFPPSHTVPQPDWQVPPTTQVNAGIAASVSVIVEQLISAPAPCAEEHEL